MSCLQDIEEKAGLKVLKWDDFLDVGRQHPAEPISSKPDDLCTIMYTSGTTGNPKVGHGAVKGHNQLCPVSGRPCKHSWLAVYVHGFLGRTEAHAADLGSWKYAAAT